jgi:hypothetical protein
MRKTSLALLLCGLPALAVRAAEPAPAGVRPAIKVHFNQDLVEGVYADLDLADPRAVLDLVFPQLADTVRVYPTENYYYFSFHAAGRTIWGNLRLDAAERDRGILYLGYFHFDENGRFQDREGHVRGFGRQDGVVVEKRGRFEYAVAYGGRTVRFLLNDLPMEPPRRALLRPAEAYVGTVFDESGLRFFLLFDQEEKHLFYVLDEDGRVAEEFERLDELVVLGRRTGFAFYADDAHRRKVLVAINGRHAARNHYYDGPFDQLPDNFVEQTKIRSYLEAAYPFTRGALDPYGTFKRNRGARMAVLAYFRYESDEDLAFVASCKGSGLSEGKFYSCITPDFQQIYDCPGGPDGPCYQSAPELSGEATLSLEVPEATVPAAPTPP